MFYNKYIKDRRSIKVYTFLPIKGWISLNSPEQPEAGLSQDNTSSSLSMAVKTFHDMVSTFFCHCIP